MSSIETEGNDTQETRKAPTLWAIGGGKGGVGKSLVCSSLAIAFARRGHRCAAIDLDLGAANLHSLLGVNAPAFTLSDFLDNKRTDLAELFCATPHPNLQLLSGARASLGMANVKHCQKEKLLRHIRSLDFDHIFLDLSAGSAFNALDFFLAADHGIAVATPERTSIENTQHFLKTAFFRSLRQVAQREPLRGLIMSVLASGRVGSARDLIHGVSQADAEQGEILARRAAEFSPMLVVNQLDSSSEGQECKEISRACRHYLAAGVRECGALPRDRYVRDALRQQEHVLALSPEAPFSRALESLASDLLGGTPISPRLVTRDPVEAVATSSAPPAPPPVVPVPPARPMAPAAASTDTVSAPQVQPTLAVEEPGEFLRCCREQQQTRQPDPGRRTWIRSLGELAAASGNSGQRRAAIAPALSARTISTPSGRLISPPLMKRRIS